MTRVLASWLRDRLAHAGPALVGIVSLAVFATGATAAYLHSQSASPSSPPAASSAGAHPAAVGEGAKRVSGAAADGKGTTHTKVAKPAKTTTAPTGTVAELGRLYLPDAAVSVPKALSAAQVAALGKAAGMQGLVVALHGTTTLGGRTVNVLAVDPGTFRGFTPRPTAASDRLWQVPARGEAIASYELNKKGKLALGGRLPLGRVPDMRIGALAEFSLPNVDVVVSYARAAAVGATAPIVYVSAPSSDEAGIAQAFRSVGSAADVTMLRPTFVPVQVTGGNTTLKAAAPTDLRTLYMRGAATCPGLPWQVLAAIGQVESNHGQIQHAVSSAGAEGPMQFMPATWAVYGVDGDGDGKADIWNYADAVYSAARYLCASGGGQTDTLYDAVYAYNHSDYYVKTVLGLAAQYH